MDGTAVLVIDDEPEALDVMVDMLEDAGFTTVAASGSGEALAALLTLHVDVVVSDVMMPGLNGLRLLELVRRERPAVEVILVTGYAARHVVFDAWQKGACGFLEKPFAQEQLVAAVTQAAFRARARGGTRNEPHSSARVPAPRSFPDVLSA